MQRTFAVAVATVIAAGSLAGAEPPKRPLDGKLKCRPNTVALLTAKDRWGGPQGVFLEGEELELLSFDGFSLGSNSLEYTKEHQFHACGEPPATSVLEKVTECQPITMHTRSCTAIASKSICGFPAGDEIGVVVVPGYWDRQGKFTTATGRFTVSCRGDAWKPLRNMPPSMAPRKGYLKFLKESSAGAVAGCITKFHVLDEACVRAYRADYCGDGEPSTSPGTWVDLAPAEGTCRGFERTELRFEALWNGDGATEIDHQRWKLPDGGVAVDLSKCDKPFGALNMNGRRVRAGTPTVQTQSAMP